MKKRPEGFLGPDKIDQEGEVFDYIRELHEYLWRFVRCELGENSGDLHDFVDIAINRMERRNKNKG